MRRLWRRRQAEGGKGEVGESESENGTAACVYAYVGNYDVGEGGREEEESCYYSARMRDESTIRTRKMMLDFALAEHAVQVYVY